MDLPGVPRSIWRATVPETPYPRLEGEIEADVAVVGGGITGLTTALLLADADLRVVILEARRIGAGTTGGTTGKVTSQHGLHYADLIDEQGEDAARTYAEVNEHAVDAVVRTSERLGLDAVERRPAYVHTRDEAFVEAIEDEVEAASRVGLSASFTTETDLPFPVLAAVRFEDQAQLHPMRYLHGLARAVAERGVVFERSRVLDVGSGDPCVVRTEHGSVHVDHVVLATLFPIIDRGFEFARAHPYREHGLLVRLDGPAPHGMYISAESPSRSIRPYGDEEGEAIVLVGESHETVQDDDTRERYAALAGYAHEHFPVREISHRWEAQDFVPVDRLPFIGPLTGTDGPIHIATGLNKWGLSLGTVAAHVIRDAIIGREHPAASLFDPSRVNLSAAAKSFVEENLEVAARFVGDRLNVDESPVDQLEPGEGRIVEVDGEAMAVCRTDEGEIVTVSPRCPHLGCYVRWNRAERSWDCPCHGSRFSHDGEVLEGPAVEGLTAR